MDPRVSQLLTRLGGLYRDPTRVDRDASSLLRSSVGKHLKPAIDHLFENDGQSHQTLCLKGTIEFHFRGTSYQQLVDIYLPSGYPTTPPTCYVRLAPNMYIKEAHTHVGSDGQVYLPYLHEWRPHTHNLVVMVVAMSSTFSDDPPVFSRTAPPQPQPPPPDYRTAFSINNNTNEAATAAALAFEEAKLLRDAEEASRLEAEALAATKKEDEERQRQLAIQEEWDAKNFASVKERVRRKIVLHLTDLTKTQRSSLQSDWQDKQRLEQSKGRLERQINDLANSKRSLEMAVEQVDQATVEVTAWLQDMADNNDDESTKERSIDDLVVPETTLDKQLLDLSAENHSLTDTMYFLDQALHRTTIDLQSYLKEIRALAKKQFLVKAHFIKITQTMRINQNSGY